MTDIARLIEIMARLRDPQGGCPWDREQTFATVAPYTIEEAYEVAEAIEHADLLALCDELGDLLFQVVFHARMAEERGAFAFADVVTGIVDKMLRRHPHVFGDATIASAAEQTRAWETHKAAERALKSAPDRPASVLDGVTATLPALTRAVKLQKRAARVGFDWPDAAQVADKIAEETAELRAELGVPDNHDRLVHELGDLLFACVNLARHLDVNPEVALRDANRRFERRFRHVEAGLEARGQRPESATLAEMDQLWEDAKRTERGTDTTP